MSNVAFVIKTVIWSKILWTFC